jgi:hypothetical protein
MNLHQIQTVLERIQKGANIKVTMERPVELLSQYKGLPLFKRTFMTVRIGIENDNRSVVQQARENGERPSENQGLNGLEWVEAPILLRSIKNPEQYYLRMEPSSNENERAQSTFFIREAGKETTVKKCEYLHMMRASENQEKPYHACFNAKIERISRIHSFLESEMDTEEKTEEC